MKLSVRVLLALLFALTACTGGGNTEPTCPGSQVLCEGLCVTTTSDEAHCGGCGKACATGQQCTEGTCTGGNTQTCGSNQTSCAGVCVSLEQDVFNCGTCGTTCGEAETCQSGTCACAFPLQKCSDTCVDIQANGAHCGKCGNQCPDGQVCTGGRCQATCPPSTPATCQGGCVNTQNNILHCGNCNNACRAGLTCTKGKCNCPEGYELCSGRCVDTSLNRFHCGGCGIACEAGQLCGEGKCITSCPQATPTVCFGGCADLQTNNTHCGECGKACPGSERCQAGACVCGAGAARCDDVCTMVDIDPNNCGTCGNKCPKGVSCLQGSCQVACEAGLERCGNDCVDLKKNIEHCGACGVVCQAGYKCLAGLCEAQVELVSGKKWFQDGPASKATFYRPRGMAFDAKGHLFVADSSQHRIRMIDTKGDVSTLSGTGTPLQRTGPLKDSWYRLPVNIAVDSKGDLIVSDRENGQLRKLDRASDTSSDYSPWQQGTLDEGPIGQVVTKATGAVIYDSTGQLYVALSARNQIALIDTKGSLKVIAGDPKKIAGAKDGSALTAQFRSPEGLALDETNKKLYISDRGNHLIRVLDLAKASVSTLAGSGKPGNKDDTGTLASFRGPHGLALKPGGGMLYVADTNNHSIRQIKLSTGVVTTWFGGIGGYQDGPLTDAKLNRPHELLFDAQGNLFIADTDNHVIRLKKANEDKLTTAYGDPEAGRANGAITDATFRTPSVIAIGPNDNIYVAEQGRYTIRKLDLTKKTVSVVAGSRVSGFKDGKAKEALFGAITGMIFDKQGMLYISDGPNHRLRVLNPTTSEVSTLIGTGTKGASNGAGPTLKNATLEFPGDLSINTRNQLFILEGTHRIRKLDLNTMTLTTALDGFGDTNDVLWKSKVKRPSAITSNPTGLMFFSEFVGNRIRRVSKTDVVSLLAGTGAPGNQNGPGSQATFQYPVGLAADNKGNVFVTEEYSGWIRRIDSEGNVSNFAGGGPRINVSSPSREAGFAYPKGLAFNSKGQLYIADRNNHMIRVIIFQ